ncbi:MAG: 1,4-dihydroxy-6-naphthoate synthase [Desulfatitalea sp.]|nr:1,4-dihydroxy-6-naphthoate synthase [Desulfatitalea sp.]NNK02768.1 1,4-dihydroxy-6-naphthoate synthase [Desulfatitalea sp.]
MQLTLGFSPCPNDTFIFNALVNGPLNPAGFVLAPVLHDVETLNRMAFDQRLDAVKLSFFAWLKAKKNYRLLSSGGALGFGCGPVVVSAKARSREDMAHCRVVLPGEWTTAHLLFRLWAPEAAQRYFTTYDRIFAALHSQQADCGVLIHESRFTYMEEGFRAVADLGRWWEERTRMPIPLGCIAVHRRVPEAMAMQLQALIRDSISHARANPGQALPYIRQHAQEMTPQVLDAHIDTFVNDFSLDLGETGRRAVSLLETHALAAGFLP